MNAPVSDPPPIGWILYDDSCGFCRRWISILEHALCRRGFLIAPLQADWVIERLGIPADQVLDDLRLLLADGSHLSGAAAYRYAMRRIWWAWPVYVLSMTPGFRSLFDQSYRTFSRNRYWFSTTCGLR